MLRKFLFLLLSGILLWQPAKADNQAMPYLYYYSYLLGGLIIEHPDGSDSRLIGEDVIPARIFGGLGGAGWSPSGDYFAAYSINMGEFANTHGEAYILDTHGNQAYWFYGSKTRFLEWSPHQENLLLAAFNTGRVLNLLVVNLNAADVNNRILASYSFSAAVGIIFPHSEAIDWRFDDRQITYYFSDEFHGSYRVTMDYLGNIQQESISYEVYERETVDLHKIDERPYSGEDPGLLHYPDFFSPSGNYMIQNSTLRNLETQEEVALPVHSEATTFRCGLFYWDNSEEYIISHSGTIRAGGGCSPSVFGVMNREGTLWRELGVCSWDSVCANWLPPQVDVTSMPAGQEQPVQLDAVAYEPATDYLESLRRSDYQMRCGTNQETENRRYIMPMDSQEILFELDDESLACPYSQFDIRPQMETAISFAYNEEHQLLATYTDGIMPPVSIWKPDNEGIWQRVLWLNSAGYELEFSADGSQLRAHVVHGWKIFNVEDILSYANEN